jgi:dihydroxyacetone kinase
MACAEKRADAAEPFRREREIKAQRNDARVREDVRSESERQREEGRQNTVHAVYEAKARQLAAEQKQDRGHDRAQEQQRSRDFSR